MTEADAMISRPAVLCHEAYAASPPPMADLCRTWEALRDEAADPALPYSQCSIASDLSDVVENRMLSAPVRSLADIGAFARAYARHLRGLEDGMVPFRFDDAAVAALMDRIAGHCRQNA